MADTEERLETEINQPAEKKQKLEEDKQLEKAEKVDKDFFYDSDDIDGYGSDDEERQSDYKKYNQQLEESGGYFVDSFPKMDPSGAAVPLGTVGTSLKISELAINWYNKNNGTNYKVTEVVYGVGQVTQYIYYNITFCAKENNGEVKTFQAKVCQEVPAPGKEIRYCDIADDNATAVVYKFISEQRLDHRND